MFMIDQLGEFGRGVSHTIVQCTNVSNSCSEFVQLLSDDGIYAPIVNNRIVRLERVAEGIQCSRNKAAQHMMALPQSAWKTQLNIRI